MGLLGDGLLGLLGVELLGEWGMLLGDGLLDEWGASSSAFAITCRIEVLGKYCSTLDRITACNPSKHKQPTAQPALGAARREAGGLASLSIYL
eukprot:scaffold12312_cov63-Phaeocystis_antarctica.AAC.2